MGRASRKRRRIGFEGTPVPLPRTEARVGKPLLAAPVEVERGLERLAEWREERDGLDRAMAAEVAALVAQGVSWGEVGRALGMTRQGARQRYGGRAASATTTVVVS
jgi:hypothetical protein